MTARAAVVGAIAIVAVVLAAGPASAHTAAGPRPTNFRTTLISVSPRIPGITVRVADLGNKLELTNRTGSDATVLGYDGEPYLRVGPRGLYDNVRSPAVYLNRTRAGTTPVPPIAARTTASTPPSWHRVSGAHTAIWHDHRIHWMGASAPPVVQVAPGSVHTIVPRWTVSFRYGTRTVTVAGRLEWIPGPGALEWLPYAGALFAVGLLAARRRGAAAITAICALVGVDLAHTITAEAARAGAQLTKVVQYFGDNFVSIIVWVAAAVTIHGLRRRRVEALYGTLLVGGMIGLVSGITDLSYLWKSQLPAIGPHVVARAEVATAVGLGLGLAAGALLALRRDAPRVPAGVAHDEMWVERLVTGLDDDQLALECSRLDASEVVPVALADLAARLAPVAPDLGSDALVFTVLAQDEVGTYVWSITAAAVGSRGLRVQRAAPAPARVELRVTFPALLGILAGVLSLEGAASSGRLDVAGDRTFLAAVEPLLVARGSTPAPRAPSVA